jgi:hypothetical protein
VSWPLDSKKELWAPLVWKDATNEQSSEAVDNSEQAVISSEACAAPSHVCSKCGRSGSLVFQPIQTYETHIEITFWEHIGFDDEKRQVPMCRGCALEIARASVNQAHIEGLTFYANIPMESNASTPTDPTGGTSDLQTSEIPAVTQNGDLENA